MARNEHWLFADMGDEPTMRHAPETPHEHQCPIHGRWYHVDPECIDKFGAPCPDEYGRPHGESSEDFIR